MNASTPTPRRHTRSVLLTIAIVTAAAIGFLVYPSTAPSSSASPPVVTPSHHGGAADGQLKPGLREALHDATADAAAAGISISVNSGWRSPEHQAQLLRKAIVRYGSEANAAQWVATPETSPHVSGDAVDIGPTDAMSWLSQHGAAYGLCQIYANEPWHYELRSRASVDGCPPMYADPTRDPRMQR